MPRVLVGLLAAGGLITLYFGWSGLPLGPQGAHRESTWQLRELAFLKAAYDRMQQDMTRPVEASASLHAEQGRILRQIAETAQLLPAEAVPAELRALLPESETAQVSPTIEPIADDRQNPELAVAPTLDLRVGLRGFSVHGPSAAKRTAEFAMDPVLREPIRREPQAERVERVSRHKPRDDAGSNQP